MDDSEQCFYPPSDMRAQQDLSSPEEENTSFHTPIKHAPGTNASSMYSVLTSQDSIDIFHDAFSTLNLPQRTSVPPCFLYSPCRNTHQRRRHFSSGAKFGDEQGSLAPGLNDLDWEDEVDEHACMLPKGPLARIRHCSQGPSSPHVSKSCNGSPFHVPRLSLSTNSLRRKSLDKFCRSCSPQKHNSGEQGESTVNYVPCQEVEMIKETEEPLNKDEKTVPCSLTHSRTEHMKNGTIPSLHNCSLKTHVYEEHKNSDSGVDMNSYRWKENYVPCTELQTFWCSGHVPEHATGKHMIRELNKEFCSSDTIQSKRKGNAWQKVKEEFSLSNFKLNHKSPQLFVTSQWQQPNHMCCMYLAYRFFWAVYFTMWAIWSWIAFGGYNSPSSIKAYYFIFLSNWGIWLLAFDTMFQAVNVFRHMRRISLEGVARYYEMKKVFKISWILSSVTSTIHIFIALIWWLIIYPGSTHTFNVVSVNIHLIPVIYVILDSLVSSTPRRILHAYLPMGFATFYGIFTVFYYLAGGISHKGSAALYPIMDWSQPSKTVLIAAGIVLLLIPFLHIITVCLYALRVRLWRNVTHHHHHHMRYDQEVIETVRSIPMEEKV